MMYARMPELTPDERLARLAPMRSYRARASRLLRPPARRRHVAKGGRRAIALRISMLGDRPVYRVQSRGGWTTIFADTGEPFRGLTPDRRSISRGGSRRNTHRLFATTRC